MWRGSLNVCLINCRSIATENRRVEFEEALMKIRFDVFGLSETWIAGSGQDLFRKSGCMQYYSGGQYKRRGVGFIVAPHLVNHVYRFTPINDRCCTLEIRTDRFTVCFVMGYAPTSDADDRDYESFLSCLQRACNQFCGSTTRFGTQNWAGRRSKGMGGQTAPPRNSRKCTILLGDFNASVGTRAHPQEPAVGPYGYGIRNHRGEQLVSYCSLNGWKVANSYCKQWGGSKWTWRAPNGATFKLIKWFRSQLMEINTVSFCSLRAFGCARVLISSSFSEAISQMPMAVKFYWSSLDLKLKGSAECKLLPPKQGLVVTRLLELFLIYLESQGFPQNHSAFQDGFLEKLQYGDTLRRAFLKKKSDLFLRMFETYRKIQSSVLSKSTATEKDLKMNKLTRENTKLAQENYMMKQKIAEMEKQLTNYKLRSAHENKMGRRNAWTINNLERSLNMKNEEFKEIESKYESARSECHGYRAMWRNRNAFIKEKLATMKPNTPVFVYFSAALNSANLKKKRRKKEKTRKIRRIMAGGSKF